MEEINWAASSGGERFLDAEEVTGSNPVPPIFPRDGSLLLFTKAAINY
jgi:hypothetical protein